jgi:hypothetical protein
MEPNTITSGANPTIVSYNTSAVKICNAKISLVHFENKNILFCLINALLYYNVCVNGCKIKSRRISS